MDIMPFHITSDRKSEESAYSAEAVFHHGDRVDQQLAVNVVHRIRLDLNIDQRDNTADDRHDGHDIRSLLILPHPVHYLADQNYDQRCLNESDGHVLRGMDSEEVPGKSCEKNHYTADDCEPAPLFILPDCCRPVKYSGAHRMSAWK